MLLGASLNFQRDAGWLADVAEFSDASTNFSRSEFRTA